MKRSFPDSITVREDEFNEIVWTLFNDVDEDIKFAIYYTLQSQWSDKLRSGNLPDFGVMPTIKLDSQTWKFFTNTRVSSNSKYYEYWYTIIEYYDATVEFRVYKDL